MPYTVNSQSIVSCNIGRNSFNDGHKIFTHSYSAWSPQPWRKWPVLSFSCKHWILRNNLDKCTVVVSLGLRSWSASMSARRIDDEFDTSPVFTKAAWNNYTSVWYIHNLVIGSSKLDIVLFLYFSVHINGLFDFGS